MTETPPVPTKTSFRSTSALELGVRRLCVCDTCGHVTPDGVRSLLNFIDEHVIKDAGFQRSEMKSTGMATKTAALALRTTSRRSAGADVIHGTALGLGYAQATPPLDQTLVNLKLMGAIDNDLTLGNTCRKPTPTGVPLPRNICSETMRSRPAQASGPPRSRPCARATIGLLTVSTAAFPRVTSGFNSAFASATWQGVRTSSTGLSSGRKPATTSWRTCLRSPNRSAA